MGSSSSSTSAGATSCRARPTRPRSPPLSVASGRVRASSGSKPSPCEHRVDARRDGVAALALEALEIAAVALQHLRRAASPARRGRRRLLGERVLERQQLARTAPAAASQTVVAPPKSRCCSSSEMRSPLGPRDGARASARLAGDQPEQRRLAGAVAADDAPALAPATVKVMSLKSTRRAELDGHGRRVRELWSPARPVAPRRLRRPTVSAAVADQRHPQQMRLLRKLLEPALVPVRAAPSPSSAYRRDSRSTSACDAELLREAPELAERAAPLLQVHEVGLDPPFGEEAQRLSRLRALLVPKI